MFNDNASKVHLYIVQLISENEVAKQKLLPHKDAADGHVDYFSLQEFYEGVGANAKYVLTAEKYIQEIFYRGGKPPHMWWDKFEVKSTNNLAGIDKTAGRQFNTDVIELRMFNSKVRSEFLVGMKTKIDIQMNMELLVITYTSDVFNYCNIAN